MIGPENMPDPETPEWTIARAIKDALRRHLGPKHGYLPAMIARQVIEALRLSNWQVKREKAQPPHSTSENQPGAS